jgi:hypothetical protein
VRPFGPNRFPAPRRAGAFTFTGLLGALGVVYYLIRCHGRPAWRWLSTGPS